MVSKCKGKRSVSINRRRDACGAVKAAGQPSIAAGMAPAAGPVFKASMRLWVPRTGASDGNTRADTCAPVLAMAWIRLV